MAELHFVTSPLISSTVYTLNKMSDGSVVCSENWIRGSPDARFLGLAGSPIVKANALVYCHSLKRAKKRNKTKMDD